MENGKSGGIERRETEIQLSNSNFEAEKQKFE